MSSLPVRMPRRTAMVRAAHTRRAGWMIALMTLLVMGFSSWGLGWVALLSACVPLVLGTMAAGVAESSRRGARAADAAFPFAVGGAFLGAMMGGALAPLWAVAAAAAGSKALFPAAGGAYLVTAGMGLGGLSGAASGLGLGWNSDWKDPLTSAGAAGATAFGLAFAGLTSGAFAQACLLFGGWLGADATALAAALAYAPGMMGAAGIAAVAATAAFSGTLTIRGVEARENQYVLTPSAETETLYIE